MNSLWSERQLLSFVLIFLLILSPVLAAYIAIRRTSAKRSLRIEAALSIVLIIIVLLAWAAFVAFLSDISDEVAGLNFIRNHLALGEDPEWVLGIAGEGIRQPLDAIITWRWFQWGTVIAGIFLTLLAWLAARLWRAEWPSKEKR